MSEFSENLFIYWHPKKGLLLSTASPEREKSREAIVEHFGGNCSYKLIKHKGYKLVKAKMDFEIIED